jgi:hypothetical protein
MKKLNLGEYNDNLTLKVPQSKFLENKATSKINTRVIFKDDKGNRLPSVTKVLGILDKPALVRWAWNLGMQGVDYTKVRDQAGIIGTITHYLIMCHLKKIEPDLSEYAPENIDKAGQCLIKYLNWESEHTIKPILTEEPLVSNIFGYGGIVDCLAELDGELALIDYKTNKAIYIESFYQLGAYSQLLLENEHKIVNSRILRIGRSELEGFEQKVIENMTDFWDLFYHCLQVYNLKQKIEKENK